MHSGTLQPSSDISGIYTYYVQGQAPCPDAQAFVAVEIDPCTSVGELQGELPMRWSGQHADGSHLIQIGDRTVSEHVVFDATGRAVPSKLRASRGDMVQVDLGSVPTGMYMIRLRTEDGIHVLRALHQVY